MKYIIFYMTAVLGTTFISCQKEVKEVPMATSCIEDKIKNFKLEACDRGAKVTQYNYQGQNVYVFNPGFCGGGDVIAKIYSENCEELGTIGGVTGNREVNGGDFALAQEVGVLWKK